MQSARTANRDSHSLAVRGRNQQRYGTDVLFMINGRRLNEDHSGSASLFNRFLSTANLERVEVIRGPGSALYGSNAFLGVVNMITTTDLNDVYLGAGDPGLHQGHVNVSTEGDGWRGSLFAAAFEDEGERFTAPTGAGIRDPQRGMTAQGTLEAGRLRLEARLQGSRVDDFWLYARPQPSEANRLETDDGWVAGEWRLIERVETRLTASALWRRTTLDSLVEVIPQTQMLLLNLLRITKGTEPFLTKNRVDQDTLEANLDGSHRTGPHQISAGIGFRRVDVDTFDAASNYSDTDLERLLQTGRGTLQWYGGAFVTTDLAALADHREILDAYVQDQVALGSGLHATAGLRWDDYEGESSNLSPRLALVWQAPFGSAFKLMYGEAFRVPTLSEEVVVTRSGSPALDPERVRTLEAAWLHDFGRANINLTGFHSRIRDTIGPVLLGPRGVQTYANLGDETLAGLELEAVVHLTDRLSLRLTGAHMLTLPDSPQTAARNLASFVVNYDAGGWNLNLNGWWHDEVETTPLGERLDPYLLANLNLRWQPVPGPVTLVAAVDNLFDEDYATFVRTAVPGGTPNRGRTFRFGAELAF